MGVHRRLHLRLQSVAPLFGIVLGLALALPSPAAALILTTSGPVHQAGYDRDVTLTARVSGEGEASFSWRQVEGPEVALTGADSDTLSFRTKPLLALVPEPRHTGVVAIPASGVGRYVFEVTATRGDETARGLFAVQSAYASTGTRGVAVDTDVVLAGPADQTAWLWSVEGRAYDAEVTTTLDGADTRFPVVRLLVKDDLVAREALSGAEIKLYGGTWDGFEPCGRCHEPEQDGWEGSLHATVLERGLRGLVPGGYREECLACHALGWQPGVDNGGFDDVARRIGWRFPTRLGAEAAALPPELARLGGVECLSCHGPGRFTPARFDTGMCAACHDLPPRYPHVAEWSATRMARLPSPLPDDHPALRRPCTRCHSTQGFVRWAKGAREPDPPIPAEAEAIACAACHDPHDARRTHQLRFVDRAPIAGREVGGLGVGAVCVACHATAGDDPHAPQGDVLVADAGENPHRGLPGTCVACHRPHGFAAVGCGEAACAACHEGPCDGSLRREVDGHLAELDAALGDRARSARPSADESRAALLLETVRRDGSHGAHNPPHVRSLLREAARLLGVSEIE